MVHYSDLEPTHWDEWNAKTEVDVDTTSLKQFEERVWNELKLDQRYGRWPEITFLDPMQQSMDLYINMATGIAAIHGRGEHKLDLDASIRKAIGISLQNEEHIWVRYPRIDDSVRHARDRDAWWCWYRSNVHPKPHTPACVLKTVEGYWSGPGLQPIFWWTDQKLRYKKRNIF